MRSVYLFGVLAILFASFGARPAFAQTPDDDDDSEHETEEPKEAEKMAPKAADAAAPASPAAPTPDASPPADPGPAPITKPKFGDTNITGYLRGSFGASNQKGRMTCFSLALPGALKSKYRLGNECEVWSETHFTTVVYAGNDGTVAHVHFMPTVYIPTTALGYSPNSTVSSPEFTTSTGAALSFPNLYVDLQGIPWLAGGTVWAGNRYYKRESVYISDFFYWNPSGVGAGIEDIHLGRDLRLSYAAFAIDGEPVAGVSPAPSLPPQNNFGIRNDIQLRGIRPYASGEFQIGVQVIANYSNDPATHGGWGVTLQHVQQLLGGENKAAVQYGRGGGTGFGTLARFYYPDFSVRHELKESRLRFVDVLTAQPASWLGGQAAVVYQHDDLGTGQGGKTDWFSAGARLGWAPTEHAKLLGEAGFDRVKKDNGADALWLAKFTIAPAITAGKEFMTRPELRVFYTYAMWNEAARTATVDSGQLYTPTNKLSGSIFGVQAETWW
ncbi:MAG TPA: carbohydrate porin [Polyangiaceae bacterium]|nr:carbohydrate porin [Polyangiaceae bacterium]